MSTAVLSGWQCFTDKMSGFGLSKFVGDSLLNEVKSLSEFNIMSFKSVCGFGTAVLSQPMTRKPLSRLGHHLLESVEKSAVLVIANNETNANQSKAKRKRTGNRKRVTMADSYKGYEVNSKKSGLYPAILQPAIDLLEATQEKYKRALLIRFDLRQPHYTENSTRVSKFFKNLCRWIKGYYQTDYVGYFWVREQEKAKHQHYHCFVLIDGDAARSPSSIIDKAVSFWDDPRGGYDVHHGKKGMYKMLNSPEKLADAIHWVSYLAKARGKGARAPQAKDYGHSRLPSQK
jgi:hypothetical protein